MTTDGETQNAIENGGKFGHSALLNLTVSLLGLMVLFYTKTKYDENLPS